MKITIKNMINVMIAIVPLFMVNLVVAMSNEDDLLIPQSTRKMPKMEYDIRGIALFTGSDPFSYVIRGLTNSKYSHVGAILSKHGADQNDQKNWYCFESTGDAIEILERGQLPSVRISSWLDVVKNYNGGIYTRMFNFKAQPDYKKVTKFVEDYDGRPYEIQGIELIQSYYRDNKKAELSTVFCSELAAQLFFDVDLLKTESLSDSQKISNNYIPKDFSTERKNPLPFIEGVALTKEKAIKNKTPSCCIIV